MFPKKSHAQWEQSFLVSYGKTKGIKLNEPGFTRILKEAEYVW